MSGLPVLDLRRFRSGDHSADRGAFLDELRRAAREVGFFTVVGHGIPPALTARLDEEVRAFFALPLDERLTIENTASPHFRGYSRVGTERTAGAADQREQIDIGPERAPVSGDARYWGLVGPNQWPPALPALRAAVLAWQDEALRVSREILRALAASLGQAEDHFDRWFDEESHLHLKVLHYPGGAATAQGVGAHKDYGFLALLHQDDVGGLEVQVPGADAWIGAAPVPDGYVVNIGEMLEVATRGYLTATRHRVVGPAAGVDRYSVAFFLGPRLDAVVEPVDLPPELAAETGDWDPNDDPDNPLLAAYGENALVGWLRSHPTVAERFWS
ncbi:2-oxobutyrate oxidase [Actinomycetospora sp. NBRC 106375]|uniref:isopenicillin N synthase family dioxygenase n=1 Tax=Actinomycetospora sp. NBRC 106375 TaxID=3032207 RepID=UPI0024A02EBE|nr:2-oxoglutarate and iron-dependent oxygenase domain-containing protein [Actinomycetospora sp. NBRC 106375]GLZ47166.1 2-oxobutyrate oxidase [Actinomycetospora sp. NBRC 106375]